MSQLHVRLDSLAHGLARPLELVHACFVQKLLDVGLLPVQLLERVERVIVRWLGAIHRLRLLILVVDAECCLNGQRVSVVVDITLLVIEVTAPLICCSLLDVG